MKKLVFGLTAALVASTVFGGTYSKFTADYYKADYEAFEGRQVTLKVTHIKPYSYKSDIPGIHFFHAITFDSHTGVVGGEIPIAVPAGKVEDLMRRYGTVPDKDRTSQTLTGILTADGHRLWFVDVNGSIGEMVDARRQELMDKKSKHAEAGERMAFDHKERGGKIKKSEDSESQVEAQRGEDHSEKKNQEVAEFKPTPPPGWQKKQQEKSWWKVWE